MKLQSTSRHGRRRLLAAALLVACLQLTPSCFLVEYSDRLVDERTRSGFVTQPASIGGLLGFIIGVPLDFVGLPISYTVYRVNKTEDEENLDPLSTLLFPSFVLWRAGVLAIGTPLDLLEFTFYRAWRRPPAQELPALELEDRLDAEEFERVLRKAVSGSQEASRD